MLLNFPVVLLLCIQTSFEKENISIGVGLPLDLPGCFFGIQASLHDPEITSIANLNVRDDEETISTALVNTISLVYF
jgi:hypothetical protein